jgi:hypothetical protein
LRDILTSDTKKAKAAGPASAKITVKAGTVTATVRITISTAEPRRRVTSSRELSNSKNASDRGDPSSSRIASSSSRS